MIQDLARESLVLALKERVAAPPFKRAAAELRAFFWKSRPRLDVEEPTTVDAALDEVIARFPKTLDYLAK
jgi:hypothetical protein